MPSRREAIKRKWKRWRYRRVSRRLDRARHERQRVEEEYDNGDVTLGVLAYEIVRDCYWRLRYL